MRRAAVGRCIVSSSEGYVESLIKKLSIGGSQKTAEKLAVMLINEESDALYRE